MLFKVLLEVSAYLPNFAECQLLLLFTRPDDIAFGVYYYGA